jgi:uncharacterized membrane protein (DUF4010 family)
MEENLTIFGRFAVAMFAGIMIGMQREYASDNPDQEIAAGVRTFALLALLGSATGFATQVLDSAWPLIAIILVIGLFFAVNFYLQSLHGNKGLTTEVTGILTLLVGALIFWQHIVLGVALSVIITLLLALKIELHRFAQHISRENIYATLKLALISAVVLPILPNQKYGPEPFNIFNPFKIWLLVVFISAISFVGYVLIKIIGARKGIGLTGLLGGLASSTAATLMFTQKSKTNASLSKYFALAIISAWTVMFLRVIIEVGVVSPSLVKVLWLPILLACLSGLAYAYYLFRNNRRNGEKQEVEFSNPFELGPAIKFGLIFVIVLFISKAAQIYSGDTGVYISSFIAGLADVDAIALSMAELFQSDSVESITAARAIIIAAVANTLAKGGIVFFMGHRSLAKAVFPGFILMAITALTVVFLI